MTCADVASLLDRFVDAELPAPMLLAVARHAGACPACETAVRELTGLREVLERTVEADVERLDLGGVWPAVAHAAERVDARRAWVRRVRLAPVWGVGLAAASALFWLRSAPAPVRVAAHPVRPNQAIIERIDSGAPRLELRRERKNGTTLIMVSAPAAQP
jgi:anti-sigma factor RsiW